MTDPQLGMLMLGLFIFIIMLGFPIAFTLMAMGVSFGYYAYYTAGQDFFENRVFTLLVQKTFEVTSSDVLVAVPLFLFMGYLVERANILDRLFYSLQLSMKNVPGALAVATLITCAMFATATGIVGAVVTLMGLLALPAMLRAGYDTKLSAGVVCAGGCLGILIPPSILLIVYAATAGVSAVKLYAAAFIPGFLLAGLYVVYVIVRAMINPALAPKLPPEQTNVPLSTVIWALATSFLPLALLIVSVLGAILFGLATPSEAAAVGALMSIVLAAAYRSLNYTMMRESVYLTVRATAMVCYLFIGSWTFSAVFAVLGGQTVVEQFFTSMNLSPIQFLLLTQVIIFLLGWPLEWTEIIIIFVPIFLPLLPQLRHRSDLLRHPGCAEHADGVQHAAGRDGRLLSEGRGAAGGEAHRHLLRRASLRRPGLPHHGAGLHLPGTCVVVARLPLWIAVSRLGKTLKGCA